MTFNLYNLFIRNLFSFKGRASRKEYVCRVLFFIFLLLINRFLYKLDKNDSWFLIITFWIFIIFTWISMFQYFPLAVRRLHDLNSSGWFVLISFVPFGQLLILWLMFKKGTPGPNKYGTSSDNYDERNTTLKYNLLVFGLIITLMLLLDFRHSAQLKNQKYSLLATKMAIEYFKKGDYEEALKNFDSAIYFTPEDPNLYRARIDILLKFNRYDEAMQDCEKLIELNPSEINAYNKKIFILFKQSDYNKAIEICDLVLSKTNEKNHLIYVYIMKASILKKMVQYKESLDYIEKALFLEPDNKKAMDIKQYLLEQLNLISK
jgi:uncharacterized membrane protein YhaH (DUF805 family)/Tfp pilus assembly protein PilF